MPFFTVTKAWHWERPKSVSIKIPTSVGIKIPTSYSFRVVWEATLIGVNRTNILKSCFSERIVVSTNKRSQAGVSKVYLTLKYLEAVTTMYTLQSLHQVPPMSAV